MPSTLADLRTQQTQGVIAARIVAAISARYVAATGFDPTLAWTPVASGGAELTSINMCAGALASLIGAKMVDVVSGRFLDVATGDLLTYLALHFFQLARNQATSTIQNVSLSSALSAPNNSFAPGDVWVASHATGKRYFNLDQIELPPNSQGISGRFQAELPGASYADVAGTIDTMVTAPAGVTCRNAPPSVFLPAHQVGTSTGTVSATPLFGDPIYTSVRVRILGFGDVGTATFQYLLNDVAPWINGGPVPPVLPIPGPVGFEFSGINLSFANGSPPSFIQGSTFTILLANAILQQGNDQESDAALRARCRARWTSLSSVPTAGLIGLWAELASPEVKKVLVDADPEIPGGVIVTLASATGPATAAAQVAVSDYVLPRLLGFKGVPEASTGAGSPEETAQVKSAVARQITAGGVVDVPRASVLAVQQAADLAWLAYLASLPIGGVVVLAELSQAILDAGAVNVSGPVGATLNGLNVNLQLLANEVAVAADGTSLLTSMSWRPI